MRIRILTLLTVLTISWFLIAPDAKADTLNLADGTRIEGVITKVEKGIVYVQTDGQNKTVDILVVDSMEFNTPHLLDAKNTPIDHFLKDVEAQEIVKNMRDLEATTVEIRRKLNQIKNYWGSKQPITAEEQKGWDAAKEDFRKPLSRYQEVLNDLYFHVLAKVDDYNSLMRDANKVYVGIKGIRIGSSLVTKDMEKLPLKSYVPGAWYDTIFYEGYNLGYDDAFLKITGKTDSN